MFKAFLFNVTNSYFKFLFFFKKNFYFIVFNKKKLKKEFPLLALINMYICKQI